MKDGGPAFPQHGWSSNPAVIEQMKTQGGMTLRDWFAGQIIAAMLSVPGSTVSLDDSPGLIGAQQARTAYALADAMLKAREAS